MDNGTYIGQFTLALVSDEQIAWSAGCWEQYMRESGIRRPFIHCVLGEPGGLGQEFWFWFLLYLVSLGNLQQCFEWANHVITTALWKVCMKNTLESIGSSKSF